MGPQDISHHIRLAPAGRTGAGTPQFLQREIAFAVIAPDERHFLANDFGAQGVEIHEFLQVRTTVAVDKRF